MTPHLVPPIPLTTPSLYLGDKPVYTCCKRLADLLFVSVFFLLFWPVFLLLAILVRISSQGPALYTQIRIGRHGIPFRCFKFRSMYIDADQQREDMQRHNQSTDGVIFKMKDDPRITPIGRILRKYSLDELPQLFNVLQGDMSLVGPRPPLPGEVVQYTDHQRQRLAVKPGLTCLWQISGRSELPFSVQCQLDLEYIAKRGFWLDLKILLRTVPAVLSGKGAW